MKLENVHVTNFRAVDDSGEFLVSPITCLVGKNEAGKSAILTALAALNPHPSTPVILDKERDYPRRFLTQYGQRHSEVEAIAVTSKWRLDPKELSTIAAQVGGDVLSDSLVTVLRRYGSDVEIKTSPLNFKAAIEFLFEKFKLDNEERATIESAKTTSDLIAMLKNKPPATPNLQSLNAHLQKEGHVSAQVDVLLRSFLPKFMYFSSYDRMEGAIQLDLARQQIANGQLNQDANRGTRLFVEFLKYAGVSIDEIQGVSTYETFNAKLQAASNNITDQILEYWAQNPDLSVEVRVEQARTGDPAPFNTGMVARARIHNALHRVDTPFSERSAGFVWFFSFLIKFAQVKDESSPVILLLDEPGLTLHGKAQGDLLRFFKEKLAPHHQIVYSTHSPFMVPADDLSSVRIVEDQIELKGTRRVSLGTKVRDDVLTKDSDTLFPLQGALGYEITQSLFIGKHTLLLEGPGDILYLQALSDALKRRNRTGLDPRWTLCPAGGIDKISPFVSLFAGNALHVAALSDEGVGDKKKVEAMRRSAVLKAGHFHTVADLLGRAEADIEDIFDPEIYVNILNECYSLDTTHRLTQEKLRAADTTTTRQLKQAEAAFRLMPEGVPMLDHFSPAAWLIRNPKLLDGKSAPINRSLDAAEKVLVTFNALL